MDNLTIFGHLDGDLQKTVQFLQERNVDVVIRNEQDHNRIRLSEEKAEGKVSKGNEKTTTFAEGQGMEMANSKASKGKEKSPTSAKGRGKENEHTTSQVEKAKAKASKGKEKAASSAASCQVVPNGDVISKATLAQRARRERERSEQKKQPKQPRFFPNLTPNRCRRAWMERRKNTRDVIQSTSVLTNIPDNAPKQTVVTHSLVDSSTNTLLPRIPNLVDFSVALRTPSNDG